MIVGGGPAGLATALALRQRGYSAAVLDADRPPIDKACGEGLLPEGVSLLRQLGVNVPCDAGLSFHGIRFLGHGSTVNAAFPTSGIGLRRPALHGLMIAAAERAGAQLFWNTRYTAMSKDGVHCGSTKFPARWTIGADGQNSAVRRMAGLDNTSQQSIRYGFRQHFQIAPWSEFMEVHWCADCQIYITPTSAGETCVAVLSRDKHLRLADALLRFPAVSQRLARVETSSSERGGISLTRKLRRVQRNRVALVGDASGSIDAVTGEGLTLSFRQALALANSIDAGDLSQYERAHRRINRLPGLMSRLLLTMDERPILQCGVLRALQTFPAAFSSLLALHAGQHRAYTTSGTT